MASDQIAVGRGSISPRTAVGSNTACCGEQHVPRCGATRTEVVSDTISPRTASRGDTADTISSRTGVGRWWGATRAAVGGDMNCRGERHDFFPGSSGERHGLRSGPTRIFCRTAAGSNTDSGRERRGFRSGPTRFLLAQRRDTGKPGCLGNVNRTSFPLANTCPATGPVRPCTFDRQTGRPFSASWVQLRRPANVDSLVQRHYPD